VALIHWNRWCLFIGIYKSRKKQSTTNTPPIEEPPIAKEFCDCPDSWTEIICGGTDTHGRKAKFVISILTKEEKWVKKSDTELEKTGSFRKNFPDYVSRLPWIKKSKGLLSIGTASKDGTDSSEYKRAGRRAEEITYIIKPLSDPNYDKYEINLGRYEFKGIDEAEQRRVIIVGILEKDDKINKEDLKIACYKALKEQLKEAIGLDLQNYQNFEFKNVGK
jgi:hypothetical protein